MVFSTLEFIFIFLPVVLFLYFILKKEYQNALLLASSLLFYYLGANQYLLLLVIMILFVYVQGIIMDKYKEHKRLLLGLSISAIILVLVVLKYYNFFIENINWIMNSKMSYTKVIIPLGLSFYSFQMISYLVDVYRGTKPQKNIINLALYISFFPQLIAGPIVRYKDMKKYIEKKNRSLSLKQVSNGLWRFSIGLCKKVILANNLAALTNIVFDAKTVNNYSIMYAWLGAISFSLQIYYDFSAYSDMAIGLAEIFGFKIKENFNYPYAAKSIKDFWRKWHISLSNFFRDYVYIPLGGNRCSQIKNIRNLLIVWLLTGLWHGANWTYVLWGLIYGFLIIIENHLSIKNKYLLLLQRIGTILAVILLWVVFRSNNIKDALNYLLSMFGIGSTGIIDKAFLFQCSNYGILLFISIVFIFPIIPKYKEKYENNKIIQIGSCILLGIGVLISISFIMMQGYNPFLYFIF